MTTAQLYIIGCIIVASLDIYIGFRIWDTYFRDTVESEELEGEE